MLRILVKDEFDSLGVAEFDGVFQSKSNIFTLYFYRIRYSDFSMRFIKVECDGYSECASILYQLLEKGYADLATHRFEYVNDEREIK